MLTSPLSVAATAPEAVADGLHKHHHNRSLALSRPARAEKKIIKNNIKQLTSKYSGEQ